MLSTPTLDFIDVLPDVCEIMSVKLEDCLTK